MVQRGELNAGHTVEQDHDATMACKGENRKGNLQGKKKEER